MQNPVCSLNPKLIPGNLFPIVTPNMFLSSHDVISMYIS